MAWNDTKGTGSSLTAAEWNAHVTDQEARATSTDLTNHTGSSTIHFTEASIDHTNITNIGTTSHADIDGHIGSVAGNPHMVTAAEVGSDSAYWNAAQLTGSDLDIDNATTGQSLAWSGTAWIGSTIAGGGGGSTGSPASIFIERSVEGDIETGVLLYHVVQQAGTISEARATLGTRPTGSDFKIDIRKNDVAAGSSIFSSDTPISVTTAQSATNGLYSSEGTIDNAHQAVAAEDVIYFVVTQVGSDITGADLNAFVRIDYNGFVGDVTERKLAGNTFLTTLMYHRVRTAGTITEARATLGGLPIGTDYKVDVRKNDNVTGSSIFTSDVPILITTDQAATNGIYTSTGSLDSGQTDVAVGDVLFTTITQIGSDIPGADFVGEITIE